MPQPFMPSQKVLTFLKNPDVSGLFSSESFSNSCSSSFCCDVRFTGVSTASSMNISPEPRRAGQAYPCRAGASGGPTGCPRDFDPAAPAVNGRHFDVAAQGGGSHETGTRQNRLLRRARTARDRHFDKDIQVTRRPAAHPGLAFAGKADACAGFDTRGDVHDSERSFSTRPAPRQVVQGFLMIWPMPEQVGQVRSTVKKPCCARTLPMPEQVGQLWVRRRLRHPCPHRRRRRRRLAR